MTIYKYEIGSDDDIQFTKSIVRKLKKTDTIPNSAAEINTNTSCKETRSAIEYTYSKILKDFTVWIDENEIIYFEEK